jgi:hypothetical protein
MVSTRSQTKQAHLEDITKPKDSSQTQPRRPHSQKDSMQKGDLAGNTPKKRKKPPTSSAKPPLKRTKSSPPAATAKSEPTLQDAPSPVVINRAPVLQLWSACVAQFLYPNLAWSTCVSAGSAISSICAVAKGRSIGKVPERDDSEAAQRKREDAKKAKKDLDEIQVLQFHLKIKDGLVLVGNERRGKPVNEALLKKKFGDEAYKGVKGCFGEVLQSWEGEEERLSGEGFKMYERFRPDIGNGQKAWGRKGELSLETIRSVVQKK